MHAITGRASGIGSLFSPNIIGDEEIPHYVGDRLILDFHEGAGTTVRDLSGNGNDGTLTGPSWELNRLSFDGTDDYVDIPDDDSISIIGDISIVIQGNIVDFGDYRGMIGKTTSNQPAPYDFYIAKTTGVPAFFRGDGANPAEVTADAAVSTDIPINMGVIMEGTSVIHYLDSIPNGSGTLSTTIADADTNLKIGSRDDLATHWKGTMEFIRINATALSALQIQQEYLWNKFRS